MCFLKTTYTAILRGQRTASSDVQMRFENWNWTGCDDLLRDGGGVGPYLYWKTAPQGPNRESDKKLGDRKDSKYMPFVVLLFQMSSNFENNSACNI